MGIAKNYRGGSGIGYPSDTAGDAKNMSHFFLRFSRDRDWSIRTYLYARTEFYIYVVGLCVGWYVYTTSMLCISSRIEFLVTGHYDYSFLVLRLTEGYTLCTTQGLTVQ